MDKRFRKGETVEYFSYDDDRWHPARFDGYDEHEGREIVSVTLLDEPNPMWRGKWGYLDQVREVL